MSVIDELKKKHKAIASMGERIRKDARALGATFSYIDPAQPDQIVIEHPDGRKEFMPLVIGESAIKVHP